jgi:predicted metalloendopeptidase
MLCVNYAINRFFFNPTASVVSSKMNFSVNPCQDFYQFACGRFEKTTIIPDDAGSVNTINMIEGRVMAQLHTLLNSEIQEHEIRPFKMVKQMFRQCMNTGKFIAIVFRASMSDETLLRYSPN